MRIHLVALGLAAACSATADDDLRDALPRVEALGIAVPGDGALKPGVGDLAPLYVVARRTSERLNGLIAHAVGTIAGVAAHEPTARAPDRAVWGPLTAPLSPVVYRLVAEGAPDGVRYHLDAWPKAGGDVVVVAAGRAAADGHAGELHVDLARLRALDPAAEVDGASLALAYDGSTLALELDGAHYRYAGRADGGASFVFATDDGTVRAAWRGDGAGRAALGDRAVECWDTSFRRVFFAGPDGTEGQAAACADVP